jgi:hypothetical protein
MSNNLFQRNIVSFASPMPVLYFAGSWLNQAATFRRNLIDHHGLPFKIHLEPHGAQTTFPWDQWRTATASWDQWRATGQDAGTLVADPRFVDPAHDDYRLRPDSPAIALGFTPLPTEEAGLYNNPQRASWPVNPP